MHHALLEDVLQHAAGDEESGGESVVAGEVDDHLVAAGGAKLGRGAEEAHSHQGVVDAGQLEKKEQIFGGFFRSVVSPCLPGRALLARSRAPAPRSGAAR